MMKRPHQVPWWRWALLGFLLAAGLYALTVDGVLPIVVGIGVVLATLATIAGVVLQVWNPFEPRPKPHLTLRPVNGDETTEFALGTEWRAVDVEAVVENAREAALAVKPSSIGLITRKYAEPTEADYEKYKADVEAYVEDVRAWAHQADEWLCERALVLEAEIIQHNPSSVDADDAEIVLTFPKGTEEFDEDSEPPEVPERPGFPLRLSPAGRMLMGQSPLSQVDTWATRSIFPTGGEYAMKQLVRPEPEVFWGYPRFAQKRDGTLTLSYNPQTIRHHRDKAAGDPFAVCLPSGQHELHWEVFVRNLPRSVKGTWELSCPAEPTREPIDNTYDLEAALRGEPIRDLDLSALFGNQAAFDKSDRNDSSSESR